MNVILIGRNDADALGGGWHPVQDGPAGVPCRWMSPRAVVRLPGQVSGAGISGLRVSVSSPTIIQGQKPGLSAYAGKQLLGHCAELGDEGAWSIAEITFARPINEIPQENSAAGSFEISLVVEAFDGHTAMGLAFIPHEVMGNGDLRELGTLVSSIRGIIPA